MLTPTTDAATVPAFGLYGEQHADAAELLHWESIAARSRLHDWQIVPHRHEDLAQLVYVQRGPATLQLDGRTQRLRGTSVVWLPPLCVHGFVFDPAVRGHVITMCMPLVKTMLSAAPLLQQVMTTPAVVQAQHARTWLDVLFGSIAQDHARRSLGYDVAAQAAAAQLVIWMARTALERAQDAAAISPQADPALRHLRAYQSLIDQHYRAHWPISRYADQLRLDARSPQRAVPALGRHLRTAAAAAPDHAGSTPLAALHRPQRATDCRQPWIFRRCLFQSLLRTARRLLANALSGRSVEATNRTMSLNRCARRRENDLQTSCKALARPTSQDRREVGPCRPGGGIHFAKGAAAMSGKGPVALVGLSVQSTGDVRQPCSGACVSPAAPIKLPTNVLVRCPRRLRDRWRHGCRHGAPMDRFTACPASGEGTARSTHQAPACI